MSESIRVTSDKSYYLYSLRTAHDQRTVEIWKPITGWPYEVSNLGRVRRSVHFSRQFPAGRILKGGVANGYPIVTLSSEDRTRKREVQIHILVAEAFIGRRPIGKELHHKDHDRSNPAAHNLEYVTSSQNKLHSVANGYHGTRRYNAKLTPDIVRKIRGMKSDGRKVKAIAEDLGISESSIYHVIRGRNWRQVKD